MLGGCGSSRDQAVPWDRGRCLGLPTALCRAVPERLPPCRPHAARPSALPPAQRGLRLAWLVSPQEPSEECARKSTTSPRMRITSKTRPSISSVSLLSHACRSRVCSPGPPPRPPAPGALPSGSPHCWRWLVGRSPQAGCAAAVTLGVTRVWPCHAAAAALTARSPGPRCPHGRSRRLLRSPSLLGTPGVPGAAPQGAMFALLSPFPASLRVCRESAASVCRAQEMERERSWRLCGERWAVSGTSRAAGQDPWGTQRGVTLTLQRRGPVPRAPCSHERVPGHRGSAEAGDSGCAEQHGRAPRGSQRARV